VRIVAFIAAHSGPTYHRITVPLYTMPDVDVCLTNDPLGENGFDKGVDIFIWNRWLPDALFDQLPALKEKYGFRTVCDIDDYWELDPHHILFQEYDDAGHTQRQVKNIRAADTVFVTHGRLADAAKGINPNVEILPNAIARTGQFDVETIPSNLVRVFWQGSVTHENDVGVLCRPIAGLRTIAGKIKMIMAGFVEEEPAWQRMAKMYTSGFHHQYKIIPGAGVLQYYAPYQEADICLVPLVKSRFNSYKSNLKVLEAANMGLPAIASQVDPYLNMPLLYCKSGSDWIKHVTRLVKSKKRRREAGQELAEFCNEHYNFSRINDKRKQIFEYAVSCR